MKRPSLEIRATVASMPDSIYDGEKYPIGVPLTANQRIRFRSYCARLNKTQQEMAAFAVITMKPKRIYKRNGANHRVVNILFRENAYLHCLRMADELGVSTGQYASACITELMKK